MKTIKFIIISFVLISLFILAFYKTDKISIEGTWSPEKIILNEQIIFPSKIDSLFFGVSATTIIISDWNDSLYLIDGNERIGSQFMIERKSDNKHLIHLSSKQKALNGTFNLKVDTLFIDELTYEIRVEIESKSSLLAFKRKVSTMPWKPKYPVRGLP